MKTDFRAIISLICGKALKGNMNVPSFELVLVLKLLKILSIEGLQDRNCSLLFSSKKIF